MLIAIDHGNYYIKTPHHSFMAGLAEHSVRPPMADEVLEYGGSYWTLSGKRLSYRRDKTRDESYFILSLFAIAREMVLAGKTSTVERVHLAVGLPPEHYSILKDKFTQYFKRSESIHFIYNDKPFTILVGNVFVYPQAFAAITGIKSQLNQHLRVFLVDIGGYTTDVLLLRKKKKGGKNRLDPQIHRQNLGGFPHHAAHERLPAGYAQGRQEHRRAHD
jgi:plasmid segregation protein ParM